MSLSPEDYLRPEVISQVQRLDLKARFIVEGFISGLHRSPFHGFSVEFSEHRKYTAGDDVRLIDWGVYGKTDRYYIKKFQAETNLEAYLVVDSSASMGYSNDGRMSKLDYSICLAAALGYLMIRQQDPVGLFVFDESIRHVLPPKAKRSHLTQILTTLARTLPGGQTCLPSALHEIAERVSKRSMIIVLSDFLADQKQVIDALHHMRYRGHDLILMQVLDHSELTFDFDEPARFRDPETHEEIQTDPQSIQASYLEELRAFCEEYRTQCQAVRADFVTIDNAMGFDRALTEFLFQRKGRF
jgi:uncharacterized protein (DUF58 family)